MKNSPMARKYRDTKERNTERYQVTKEKRRLLQPISIVTVLMSRLYFKDAHKKQPKDDIFLSIV